MSYLRRIRDFYHKIYFPSNNKDRRDYISSQCDDIIINILSRLPAESVLQCKLVCVRWSRLVSSEVFVKAHLKRATAVTISIFESNGKYKPVLYTDHVNKTTKFEKLRRPQLSNPETAVKWIASCDGMLLLENQLLNMNRFMIYNPMTKDLVILNIPPAPHTYCGGGLYFDESDDEYKLLVYFCESIPFVYYLYGLKTKQWRKLNTLTYCPSSWCDGVKLANAMCWTLVNYSRCQRSESIMVFEFDTKELYAISHPNIDDTEEVFFSRLCNIDGSLAWPQVDMNSISLWVLEDFENCYWVMRHVIDFETDLKCHSVGNCNQGILLNILDGVLLLAWREDLIYYDLCSKSLRKDRSRSYVWKNRYQDSYTCMKTLVSPRHIL